MSASTHLPMVDLSEQINAEHAACAAAASTAIEHAWKAGALLLEAKHQAGHGEWLPWLEQHFAGSPRTAQSYMRIARKFPNAQAAAHLTVDGALKKLAAPRVRTHWALDLIPSMTNTERCALRDSIARLGVLVPIVKDQDGVLLDGRERLAAASAVGVKYRVDFINCETDVDRMKLVWSLNVLREHRTDEQKAACIAILLDAEQEATR